MDEVDGKPLDVVWNEAHDLTVISLYEKYNPELHNIIKDETILDIENSFDAVKLISRKGDLSKSELSKLYTFLNEDFYELPMLSQWLVLNGDSKVVAFTEKIVREYPDSEVAKSIVEQIENARDLADDYEKVMKIVK